MSGDTSAGGLARLDWSLGDGADAAIVELGANDGLRGVDPAVTEKNLTAILDRLAARHIPVLLSGMYAMPNLGPDYAAAFRAVFDRLGARPGVLYDPFFLDGVATVPALNQSDRTASQRRWREAHRDATAAAGGEAARGGAAGMRLFVGLELPWELRQRMAMLAGAGIPGARWVPTENYHVTLRFIGETPRYLAEEIDHALAALKAPSFALTLGGIGTFAKGGRSQTLWLGVERSEPTGAAAGQDRDRVAALRTGTGAAAVPAARDTGAAGWQRGGEARGVRAGAQSVPRRAGGDGTLHAVQLAAGQGAAGVHGGGGVCAGLER